VFGDRVPYQFVIREGSRPEDYTRRPILDRVRDRGNRSEPAGDLDANALAHPFDDRTDDRGLCPLACSRAVEIDDMDPARTHLRELARDSHGVGRVRCRLIEVAPAKPDNLPCQKIDRRNDLKGCAPAFNHGSVLTR
jgi:hypothetical protein